MTKLFDPDTPRLFALPPGVDFSRAVLDGLQDRLRDQPPEAIARVTIYVNTQAMQTRMMALLDEGGARFLPRLRTLSQLADLPQVAHLPPARAPLETRLELMQAIGHILDRFPQIAPRTALADLSESLASLIDEMGGEAVAPERLAELDDASLAEHWKSTRILLQALVDFVTPEDGTAARFPGAESRLRATVDLLGQLWEAAPPQGPVIVAGSTASRGPSLAFMQAVLRLPQGAVILPGVDTALPEDIWASLHSPQMQDHPQARFARLLSATGQSIRDMLPWTDTAPAAPERNRLISLALRPAPVTDQWRRDGAGLAGQLSTATEGLSLIEARSPLAEAGAIAMALRAAARAGKRAALISPDRELTRQVTAALDRWRIRPDDSAGRPLGQSAPGRLLRQVAAAEHRSVPLPDFLATLKHPLVCTGSATVPRRQHFLWTRALELHLRRAGQRQPRAALLRSWAGGDPDRVAWADWVTATALAPPGMDPNAALPLTDRLAAIRTRTERLAAGPSGTGTGTLWEEDAGEKAAATLAELEGAASLAGALDAYDAQRLLVSVLSAQEVRQGPGTHGDIAIWGTLEARVRGADIVILGGLNEGIWPEAPPADPWLNRSMRAQLGLLSPERRIGLSAHDFQQAVAGPKVILSRATRDEEAETVPSRWVNRLQNLLGGLGEEGKEALAGMRARGVRWVHLAEQLEDATVAQLPEHWAPALVKAQRPAPRPPVDKRPNRLSVTEISTLIRDPFAIYARHVLDLRPVDPLMPLSDARQRGNLLHAACAAVIAPYQPLPDDGSARDRLLTAFEAALQAHPVDPAMAALWRARFALMLDGFIPRELQRASDGMPMIVEDKRALTLHGGFELVAKPDRIDRLQDGSFAIYDYKTTIKTPKEVAAFEKQLPLQAAMLEAGAFGKLVDIGHPTVSRMEYISVGSKNSDGPIPRVSKDGADLVADTWEGLERLLEEYAVRTTGYRARNAPQRLTFQGDYDHLARYGEWTDADGFDPQEVGP